MVGANKEQTSNESSTEHNQSVPCGAIATKLNKSGDLDDHGWQVHWSQDEQEVELSPSVELTLQQHRDW